MKILVLNWQDIHNPLGGGAETHCHEIFKRLALWGHEVTLCSCKIDGRTDNEITDGIIIRRTGSRNLFNVAVVRKYLKEFRYEKFDIVIDDVNKIPFYTPLFVKEPLLGISHHFFGKSIYKEVDFVSASYVYLSELLVNQIYRKTPFAVVSESTRQEFLERGFAPSLFTLIPNALNHSEFPMQVGQKASHPVITYFSRIKKYKSPDHLLYAFNLIKETIPTAELWYMGAGDFTPELKRIAIELGIESRVKFFGRVSNEDKITLLTKSHLVVNTSIKEGWGITNIEANACGTPVLSANVPGLRDSVSVGLSGDLYEYGNIEQLSDKILNIITDSTLLQTLSDGAVTWAKTFSWDDSARKMEALCEDVIHSRPRNNS
jgi:glycosyltransferase involved in cell wall biosynthesis